MSVPFPSNVTTAPQVDNPPPVDPSGSGASGASGAPPAASGAPGGVDYAALGIPALAAPNLGGLSLEQLVEAIGGEGRRLAVQQGLEAIKAKGDEIKELNAKKMEEVQKQLDALKEKETLSPLLQALKWLGLALGAIASAVAVAGAVMTGNPLLIAGAVIGAVMCVNSIVSTATDGKYSIAAGVAAVAKECGADDSTAQWIGFAFEMAIAVVGAGLSLGGAWKVAHSVADAAVQTATKAQKVISVVTAATTILSGANSAASGALAITAAKYDYDIAKAKAEMQDLQAILARIQTAMESEEDFLEEVMERTQDLLGTVTDIVQENITAQTAILTGSTPGMA
jgi:hypothetical protein